ncbi:MAG: hypothetical protein J7493_11610 [Porphyrobacter sp.]|nr:hypothetical protein [Porphyrobacter sp.]
MKALLGLTTAFVAASVYAAQPASNPSTATDQTDDIIVEAQRLPEELKDTTLEFVRGRDNRVTFKIRADGTFASALRGLPSDFGVWRVEGDNVCFVGRMRGTFCGQALLNRRPGDTWEAVGYDGKMWKARLIAGD